MFATEVESRIVVKVTTEVRSADAEHYLGGQTREFDLRAAVERACLRVFDIRSRESPRLTTSSNTRRWKLAVASFKA